MQAVAVVLHVLAHVVRIAVAAEMAGAAGDVGTGHDAVADLQRMALAVQHAATDRGDLADILVAADQRIGQVALMRRARVLLAFAAERVLVGAADAGIVHPHDHGARFGLGQRKVPQGDAAGPFHHRGADLVHGCAPAVSASWRTPASRRAA